MTIEEFGQSIKTKYPQYSKYSDGEVGQKMLIKYPQYKDKIDQPAKQGILQNVADITGGGKIASGYGQVLSGRTNALTNAADTLTESSNNLVNEAKKFPTQSPRRKQLLEEAKQNAGMVAGEANSYQSDLPSNKQVVSSAAQLGLSLGGLAVGPAGASTRLGRVAETGLKMGGLSALSGATEAYGNNKDTSGIGSAALKSGLTGAVLGGGAQAVSELASYLSSPKVTESVYNKAIKIPSKAIENGKNPARLLMQEGVSGSRQQILKSSQDIANEAGGQIKNILKENPFEYKSSDVVQAIKHQLSDEFKNSLGPDEVSNIVDNLPLNALRNGKPTISSEILNDLRSEIDNKYLGSSKWLNNSTSERIAGLKTAANVMRGMVQVTHEALPDLYGRQSQAITAIRALSKDLAKPHIMSNLIQMAGAAGYGAVTGGLSVHGLKNAIELFLVEKGLSSTAAQTTTARALNTIGASGIKQVLGIVGRVATPGIAKTISK